MVSHFLYKKKKQNKNNPKCGLWSATPQLSRTLLFISSMACATIGNYKFICVYICLTSLLPIEMIVSQWGKGLID